MSPYANIQIPRVLLLSIAVAFALTAFADQPPNVVLILSDDQAWTDYGFMGHPDIKTPHLDRLPERSLVFKRGYVASPLCRPTAPILRSALGSAPTACRILFELFHRSSATRTTTAILPSNTVRIWLPNEWFVPYLLFVIWHIYFLLFRHKKCRWTRCFLSSRHVLCGSDLTRIDLSRRALVVGGCSLPRWRGSVRSQATAQS